LNGRGEDEGEIRRITSLPGFDSPTDAVREHGTGWGRKQSRQASGGADGFAVSGFTLIGTVKDRLRVKIRRSA
jgi:hypothetical protein